MTKQDDGPLSPGDTVEVGISSLYRSKGMEAWLKVGVTTKVRDGEEAQQASDRAYTTAVESLNEMIVDFDQEEK